MPSKSTYDEHGKLQTITTWSAPEPIAYQKRTFMGGRIAFRREGPAFVYKYASNEVAQLILSGKLRFRPLRAFRAMEQRDPARGDRYEGSIRRP